MQSDVENLLAKREGHFVLESGHHGNLWLDLELLCLRPERVRPLAEELAKRVAKHRPEVICGPLVEGAFVGLMVAESLRLPFVYSQPTTSGGGGLFAVKYAIPRTLRRHLKGKRVAIVNDVVNAGSAVRGTLKDVRDGGGEPVTIATLAVLGESAQALAASEGVALESLATIPNQIWEPAQCPMCAQGLTISS